MHPLAKRDIREDFFEHVHRPIQKAVLFVCGPLVVFVFIYLEWVIPGWQSTVTAISIFLLICCWIAGYKLTQRGQRSWSLVCSVLPVMVQGALVMLLFDGYNMAAVWPMAAVAVYAGFYSKRLMYVCCALLAMSVMASDLVKHWDLYPLVPVASGFRLFPLAIMSVSAGLVIAFLMRRSQILSESIFGSLGSANQEQQAVLSTVKLIQPEIDAAVQEIRQISSRLAAQSSEQAASTTEMSATMSMMQENAGETAANAEETQVISERSRTTSQENSARLKKIEQSFDDVVTTLSNAASEVTELSKQMEHIEEILGFNRMTGEQIKVLAVNAAIEADRAGDHGQGFGAVAAEFRNMIRDTEKNLSFSSDLLHKIRAQARQSSQIIIEGSEQLTRYFDDLKTAGQTVEQNTESFYLTAKQVTQIAGAARMQQRSVFEVSVTMEAIDRAAFELRDSATDLVDNVDRIVASQERLEQGLKIG